MEINASFKIEWILSGLEPGWIKVKRLIFVSSFFFPLLFQIKPMQIQRLNKSNNKNYKI